MAISILLSVVLLSLCFKKAASWDGCRGEREKEKEKFDYWSAEKKSQYLAEGRKTLPPWNDYHNYVTNCQPVAQQLMNISADCEVCTQQGRDNTRDDIKDRNKMEIVLAIHTFWIFTVCADLQKHWRLSWDGLIAYRYLSVSLGRKFLFECLVLYQ